MLKIYDLFLSFMSLRIILVTIFVIDARIFGQKLPRMPKVHKSSWESSQLLLSSELRSGAVAPKRLARYVSMPVLCCTFLRHLPPATVCSSLPPPLLLNVNVSLHSDLKIAPIFLNQYFKIRVFPFICLQWFALENQQSPFYVVNEVTLTGQSQSLKFC